MKPPNWMVSVARLSELGNTADAGQYFAPTAFYPNDQRVRKLYYFIVKENNSMKRVYAYYLEHSRFGKDYYVLGIVTSQGHAQIVSYGSICPTYWKIREDVVKDLQTRQSSDLEQNCIICTRKGIVFRGDRGL